jgi:hypothetical protein
MRYALFPSWSNSAIRAILVGAGALMVAIPSALAFAMRQPPVTEQGHIIDQPIAFDHRHHVRDLGIDCRYCHEGVDHSAYAGVPPTSRCMNCHNQVWTAAALLAPVRWSAETNTPVAWQRIHHLPDFVYFDHSVHISRGVGCSTCHGPVDTMARVYQVAPMTMGWCIDCHRDPAHALRPLDRITDMDWTPSAAEQERVGTDMVRRLGISPTLDCSGCHR